MPGRPTAPPAAARLAVVACVAAVLVGCTSPATDVPAPAPSGSAPAPAPSGSIGAAVPARAIAAQLPTDMQAETWFGMDRATWQRLHDFGSSLPWTIVSAGGVEQAAACAGEGTPTVVYIDDLGSRALWSWPLAADRQSRDNRVCLFDRPGLGLSPSRAESVPRSTPEQHAGEMLAMLAVLGEPGPYLLVAHSYGGLVARSAATQHPEAVAGMVLVDAVSPLLPGLDEPWNVENGLVDPGTIATTVGSGPDLGDRPVIVLEAGQWGPDATADDRAAWSELQRQAAAISDNSLHAVVDDSDQDIPMRNPAAVVAATSAVAESIRAGNADLPPCPDALAVAGATCTTG